ncbi:MAG TPA: hydroxymethylglutaryl-CoA lyase [Myxococcota bacterium]|jgi:hydroxymethylglutaryl-CoA lyase
MIRIHEVGARDGLQNEAEIVPTALKLALLAKLADAGLRSIEATSFVSPQWIPQLADADELAAQLVRRPGVAYSALVPNLAGYERFAKTGIEVVAFFASASESHNKSNVNRSIAEHLDRFKPVVERVKADGKRLRCYLSTVCGCPFEGDVPVAQVMRVMRQLIALGADEVSLGDTIGVGVPRQVRELVRALGGEIALDRVSLHFHDTYGRALANVEAGYEEGVRAFDSSLGGLGGCPYAPGASGNVATEDVVDLFERSGIGTGIDLDALVDVTAWVEREVLQRALPGRVYRAVLGGRKRKRS